MLRGRVVRVIVASFITAVEPTATISAAPPPPTLHADSPAPIRARVSPASPASPAASAAEVAARAARWWVGRGAIALVV
jgi:hypothetical protein